MRSASEIAEPSETRWTGGDRRENGSQEAKLARLNEIMRHQGFFDDPDQRLLIFTEFRGYLGLPCGEAEVLGIPRRLHPRRYAAGLAGRAGNAPVCRAAVQGRSHQVLVATEAAARGSTSSAATSFSTTTSLEPQPARTAYGRIHRTDSCFDCLSFNFVAANTIEGRVLQRLLSKLQEIRDALDDDACSTWSARSCPPPRWSEYSGTSTREG